MNIRERGKTIRLDGTGAAQVERQFRSPARRGRCASPRIIRRPKWTKKSPPLRSIPAISRLRMQRPPDIPPAHPAKALMIVGVVLARIADCRSGHADRPRQSRTRAGQGNGARHHPHGCGRTSRGGKPDEELVLPGSLQAYEESPIYARTNGYLVRWYKDIGSRVKEGELLATIDTPEIDQELNQTRAARQQIVAQLELAKISAERWENLRKSDSVSAQEADQQTSGYKQAQANLAAADANVRRLEQMESFKRVYAPFSGVTHQAQRRSGSTDQCRRRGCRAGTVRHCAGRSAARIHQCAASLRALYKSGSQHECDLCRNFRARDFKPRLRARRNRSIRTRARC